MVRVQFNQQVLVNFVQFIYIYFDVFCGFYVDRGGEFVLLIIVFIILEQWILGGRFVGVEDLIIERGVEFIFIQDVYIKDVQFVDLMYLKLELDFFIFGFVQFGIFVVNNDGVLIILINFVKFYIMIFIISVKNGGKVQMNSLYVIYSFFYLEVEKGGLVDGEGQGFIVGQGLGVGSIGILDAFGGSYVSYGNSEMFDIIFVDLFIFIYFF